METILLVDDEGSVRGFVRHLLEASGYAVLEASHAAEALAVCSRHEGPIDLLLTDLTMPGMNGHQLAERIKALRPDARVLYMSGHTLDQGALRQIRDGEIRMLEKPFTPEALTTLVRETLDGPVGGRSPSVVEPRDR